VITTKPDSCRQLPKDRYTSHVLRMSGSALLLPLLLLSLLSIALVRSCPRSCNCYQASEVHCTFRSLQTVPSGLPPHTRRINLGFNSIHLLQNSSLSGLKNLELLMLHSNHLQRIPPGVFSDMKNLQILKLSYNKLEELWSEHTFSGLSSLTRLYLDHNQLRWIHPRALLLLPRLRLLKLQGNRLLQLHPQALCTLSVLETYCYSTLRHLDLSNNSLSTVAKELLETAPLLETLVLHANPWSCDCGMNWLLDWTVSNPGVMKCPGSPQCPVCASPLSLQHQGLLDQPNLPCSAPLISSPGRNTPLDPSDIPEILPRQSFRESLGTLSLSLADQQGFNVDVTCNVSQTYTSPDISSALASFQSFPLSLALSFSLECYAERQNYEKLWRIMAYYSESAARLERGLMLSKAPTLAYRYRQAPETEGEYHTGVKASMAASPHWLLQPAVSIQLNRAKSNRKAVHLVLSTRVSAHSDLATSRPWVLISTNRTVKGLSALAGSTVELPCPILSSGGHKVEWIFPDGSKIIPSSSSSNSRWKVLSSGLTLQKLELSDAGLYYCKASNGKDTDILPLQLVVIELPASATRESVELSGVIGQPITISCNASGSPPPFTSWLLPNGNLLRHSSALSGGVTMEANGSLSLPKPSLRNAGHYRCIVVNQYGSDSLSTQLELKPLQTPPLKTTFPRRPQSAAGRSTKIRAPLLRSDEGSGDGAEEEEEEEESVVRNRRPFLNNQRRRGPGRTGLVNERRNRLGGRHRVAPNRQRIDPKKWADLLAKIREKAITASDNQPAESTEKSESKVNEEVESSSGDDTRMFEETVYPAKSQTNMETDGSSRINEATTKFKETTSQEPHEIATTHGQWITTTTPATSTTTPTTSMSIQDAMTTTKSLMTTSEIVPKVAERQERPTNLRPSSPWNNRRRIGLHRRMFNRTRGRPLTRPLPNSINQNVTPDSLGRLKILFTTTTSYIRASEHPSSTLSTMHTVTPATPSSSSHFGTTRAQVSLRTSGFQMTSSKHANRPAGKHDMDTERNLYGLLPPPNSAVSSTASPSTKITTSSPQGVQSGLARSSTSTSTANSGDALLPVSLISQVTTNSVEATTANLIPSTAAANNIHTDIYVNPIFTMTTDTPSTITATKTTTAAPTTVSTSASTPVATSTYPAARSSTTTTISTTTYTPAINSITRSTSASTTASIPTTTSTTTSTPTPTSTTTSTPTTTSTTTSTPTTTSTTTSTPTTTSTTTSTPTPTSTTTSTPTTTSTTTSTPATTTTSTPATTTTTTTASTTSTTTTTTTTTPTTTSTTPATTTTTTTSTFTKKALHNARSTTTSTTTTTTTAAAKFSSKNIKSPTTTAHSTSGTRDRPMVYGVDPRQRLIPGTPQQSRPPTDWRKPGSANSIPDSQSSRTHLPPPASLPISPRVSPVQVKLYPHIRSVSYPAEGTAWLHCEAEGEPKPAITWTKVSTGAVMSVSSRAQRLEVLPNGTLVIQSLQLQDRGTYICSAHSYMGRDRLLATLDVWTRPPRMQLPSYRELTTHQGGDLSMDCRAEGVPSPLLSWVLPDRSVLSTSRSSNSPSSNAPRFSLDTNGTLHLSAALPTDRGMYRCVASNSAGAASASVRIHVSSLPPVIQQPKEEAFTLSPGMPLYAHCSARGAPNPSLRWKIPSGIYVRPSQYLHGNLFVLPNGTLHIVSMGSKDTGTYECTASNAVGMEKRVVRVQLGGNVAAGNQIAQIVSTSPSLSTVQVGERMDLHCQVTGHPPPNVIWRTPSRKLVDVHFSFDGHMRMHPNGTLSVGGVTERDGGDYLCIARNKVGDDYRLVRVTVAPKPAHIQIISYCQHKAFLSKKEKVDCLASGHPEPSVRWSLPDGTIVSSTFQGADKAVRTRRLTVFNNGTLLVAAVGKGEEGEYTCYAENQAGRDTMKVKVKIMPSSSPPTFEDDSAYSVVKVQLGTTAKLPCAPTGDPAPSVTWFSPMNRVIPWTSRSGFYTERVVVSGGTLELRIAQKQDTGNYTCQASNAAGTRSKVVRLEVEVPSAIRNSVPGNHVLNGHVRGVTTQLGRSVVSVGVSGTGNVGFRAENSAINRNNIGVNSNKLASRPGAVLNVETNHNEVVASKPSNDANRRDIDISSSVANTGLRNSVAGNVSLSQGVVLTVKQQVIKGQSVFLHCPAGGSWTPRLTWLLPGNTALGAPHYGSRLTVHRNGTLELRGVSGADQGRFVCVVRGDRGETRLQQVVSTKTAALVSIINGETLHLPCSAPHSPAHSQGPVSWSLPNGQRLSSSERQGLYSVQTDGTLTVQQASVFDRGTYTCRFSAPSGVVEVTVPVIVIAYPPRITTGPAPVTYTRPGVAVELPCLAIATPRATITWEMPDMSKLTALGQARIYGNRYLSPQGSLVIQSPSSRDTGFYRCTAKNVIGADTKATYLHVI
uniref:Ig-like domain-containing protein n=1 Tax=Periophthalmus magnuspinnatus TaxID=409849 RepID=A0A3B4A490_9GOBI